jgi:hypothetical protein
MKQIKRLAACAALLAALLVTARAGNVTLGWDTYVQSSTNAVVDKIMLYGVAGSNTVFTANNANAVLLASTSVTNTTYTFTNIPAGWWTFTATAKSTSAALESSNAVPVWTSLPLPGIGNFRILVSP